MGGANNELVYLETQLVTVTIKGPASHPDHPGVEFRERESTLRVECDDAFDIHIAGDAAEEYRQASGRACTARYNLRPIFFEQQRYELIIEPEEGHRVEFRHENYNVRKNVTPVGRRSSMLSGIINFGNEIGLSDLVVCVDGRNYLKLTIEVFPSKISYKDDYRAIVADVTSEVYNLVFDFLKKTYESFGTAGKRQSSPVEFLAIIRKIYGEFMKAADMVLAKPHHILAKEHVVLPGHKVRRTDERTLRWIERHPEMTQRRDGRVLAERALAVKKYVTYDTKENRLTKHMLLSTAKRLEQFKTQYGKLQRETDKDMIGVIDGMISGIRRRCNTGFMREVEAMPANSGMSLVFGMAPGYRDVYRNYLLLQHGLSVTGSIFNVSVKDLAVLYEYWCFIKLNSLMKQRYELLSQDIIKTANNGLFVSLIKGQRSRVRYCNPENGEIITLSYNPTEVQGATVPQKPDNVLSLKKKGARVDYEYVFDAKYKIDPASAGSKYRNAYHTPGPQEGDINTMHRYRDAIVYQKGASPYERTMFGAYVLFPYRNEEEYREHRFYRSIEQVNIGGLPFLPSATSLVSQMLDELINDSPDSAFERATLPSGIEERLAKVDWARRDVLIGLVSDPEHMESFMQERKYWTRKFDTANLPVRYVALYEKGYGIRYYGETISWQQVKRDMLPGKSAFPDRDYHVFEVLKWHELKTPIRMEETGPNPIAYTNYFLLMHSCTYSELRLRSEADYRLFTELKRVTDPQILQEKDDCIAFESGGIRVVVGDEKILILQDDKIVSDSTIAEFVKRPNATFRKLKRDGLQI